MAIRNPISQALHDRIIQRAYDTLDKVNYRVYMNQGLNRNINVNGHYPDIIITRVNNNTAEFIIEVETNDTINQSEVNQWRIFSQLSRNFYLLVPAADRLRAGTLCLQMGVKAKFATYSFDNLGNININYE